MYCPVAGPKARLFPPKSQEAPDRQCRPRSGETAAILCTSLSGTRHRVHGAQGPVSGSRLEAMT